MSAHELFRAGSFSAVVAGLCSLILPAGLQGQTDDFNDGNDSGWSRYEPLKSFGAGGTFSAAGGLYRMTAPPSPAPADLGVQRVGSLRLEKTYARVRVEADITGWRDDLNQAFGLIGRAADMGLGTTTGYTYNYNTLSGFHQINLVQGEQATRQVNESPFRLNPAHRYRMVFQLVDTLMLGQMFSVTNPAVPLHSVVGTDDNYSAGVSGLFAFALAADGRLDVQFDNYAAAAAGPLRATMLDATPATGESPTEPIAQVDVRVANLETDIVPDSLTLRVDGVTVGFEAQEEPASVRLVHLPAVPLDPAKAHTAQLTFRDAVGEQVFSWGFGATVAAPPALLAADVPGGPFVALDGVELNGGSRTFLVPLTGDARFFRISDAVERRVVGVALQGDRVAISYQ